MWIKIDGVDKTDEILIIMLINTASNAVIVGDLKQLPHIPDSKVKEYLSQWNSEYSISDAYD